VRQILKFFVGNAVQKMERCETIPPPRYAVLPLFRGRAGASIGFRGYSKHEVRSEQHPSCKGGVSRRDGVVIFRFFSALLILILTFLSFSTTFAQQQNRLPTEKLGLRKVKGLAINSLRLGDTYQALTYYKEWVKRKPNNPKVSFQLAELYRQTRDYTKAADSYKNAVRSSGEKFPMARYRLGEMQMHLGKYQSAQKNFKKFKRVASDMKDKGLKKLTLAKIEGCNLGMAFMDSVNKAEVQHLDTTINKAHIEFSPIPLDSTTLIYGSLKSDEVEYFSIEDIDSANVPLRKLYLAKKENGKWRSVGEYTDAIGGQAQHHIGNGALSPDGNRFFFTQCRNNWQNKVICHLYYSVKENGTWGEPIKMNDEINLPNSTTTQPTIGRESKRNQEVIYFVSDRPGGKGGLDIWYTEYHARKKIFKTPKNVGSVVNTPGTEFTPYFHLASHTLYYSTDGKPGIGGLDVFGIEGEKTKWDKESLRNLEKAINSPADDFDYVLNKDRQSGFLVSNREGGVALLNGTCCDDIYSFKFVEYVNVWLDGLVTETANDSCLDDVEISLYITDAVTKERYLADQMVGNPCTFSFSLDPDKDYTIEVKKRGYFNDAIEVSTVGKTPADTLKAKLSLELIPDKPIVLEGILYEFNSADLTPAAKESLDTGLYVILIGNPQIIIELSSHTDAKGSDDYNLKLSQKRAESAVKHLIDKGIDKKRLVHKGYGETLPVAENTNPDGSDNPEGRALNRRTEMKIIGELSEDEYLPEQED